jgi:MFS family permease
MKLTRDIKNRTFKIFIFSNSLIALAFGLFGSFYLIFINKIGGSIENFGFAVGLVILFRAITSFVAGKYSDKIGRKPFLIIGGYSSVIIVLLYTLINSLWQLYALQIFNGIISAIFEISEQAFLGDITYKNKRGSDLGKYFATIGIVEAISVFIGGVLVGKFGFKIIFYLVSLIFFISTTIMLKLKEKN